MLIPKFTISIIRKNGALMSRAQHGDLMQTIEFAQSRRNDFPDAEVRIILDGVGVLHKFAPLKNTL